MKSEKAQRLKQLAQRPYLPHRILMAVDPTRGSVEDSWLANRNALLRGYWTPSLTAGQEGPSVHVCEGARCLPPFTNPERLWRDGLGQTAPL